MWIKKDTGQVHSQFRALLCVCKMYTEQRCCAEIYSDRSSQRMRNPICLTVFLPSIPFLRRMAMCDTRIIFSLLFFYFSASQQVTPSRPPQDSPQSTLWQSAVWPRADPLWKSDGLFFRDLLWAWMFGGTLVCVLWSLLREERGEQYEKTEKKNNQTKKGHF